MLYKVYQKAVRWLVQHISLSYTYCSTSDVYCISGSFTEKYKLILIVLYLLVHVSLHMKNAHFTYACDATAATGLRIIRTRMANEFWCCLSCWKARPLSQNCLQFLQCNAQVQYPVLTWQHQYHCWQLSCCLKVNPAVYLFKHDLLVN